MGNRKPSEFLEEFAVTLANISIMTLPELIAVAELDGRRCHAAVFAVEHIGTGRRLIVATTNLSKRLYDQRRYLNRSKHHNAALQADLLRDGPDAFRFVLLALVEQASELKYLRRLYVQRTREEGKSYHADEPEHRGRLVMEVGSPTSTENGTKDDTLRRLRAFADRAANHPEIVSAWLRHSSG